MYDKVNKKSFTLTMLGTDTVYTPNLKNRKKAPIKFGGKVQEYYPKGETLSIVSTLIQTSENPIIDHKQLAPYLSPEVAVVNGPKTEGSNVGEKIGIGLGIALNALVRGQTELNEIAHSRGGVESILIAHEINAIKENIASFESFDDLSKFLCAQQLERKKSKTYNTPDIMYSLLSQLPKDKKIQEQWFKSLKANIPGASMNLFIIDPVPGDCWPVTWYDDRFFTLPPIVKHAEFVYYENERSDWGFTPIYPEATTPDQIVVRNTVPGHHGTGSAGTNASQQNMVVSPDDTKATHVQKLLLFKILRFLDIHGVAFKEAQEIFHQHTALGSKYLFSLDEDHEPSDVSKFDFATIFRKLYDKIYKNRKAYEAFNATSYTFMGVSPQRKILRTDHKYGLLTEVFPKNSGYVNEEHSALMKEYFFKILKVDSHQSNDIVALVNTAKEVLSKNIRKISNPSDSISDHSISLAILDSESVRQDVLDSFGALIQRVSQQYLNDELSSEKKKAEKLQLFEAIIQIFNEFNLLLETDNPTIKIFVEKLIALSLRGITQTVEQQKANLEEELNHLQATTDDNLKFFFNNLLTQINKDEEYTGSAIHPEIRDIFESPDFAQLANHPVRIKIEFICKQLAEKLPQDNEQNELIEQLTERFEEIYSSSLDEFEKLYFQIRTFIQDIAALNRVFADGEAVFNKHELSLRIRAEALIDSAAQKFYRDRPHALPEPAENGTFREMVERHAINHYGVVDRVKKAKADLEQDKQQLSSHLEKMQQLMHQKEAQNKEAFEKEQANKLEYRTALNDPKEAEYLLLIHNKLIPLTQEYLAYLKSQLPENHELEFKEELKKEYEKIEDKIQKVTALYDVLANEKQMPHPKVRIREFYIRLDLVAEKLSTHRDKEFDRFCQNVLIAIGVLLSGIVPGLIALKIYSSVGYSGTKSLLFWRSAGHNVVSNLNQYKKGIDLAIQAEIDDDEKSAEISLEF